MNPKVTVLMPVYNGEKYLKEAIESVLRQTYQDFEFLIINDGSTDETLNILKSYGDKRIRIVSHKKNMQLVATLNEGVRLAKGEYIARMDADDVSVETRLEEQYKFLESRPEIGVVGSSCEVIDANGKFVDNYYYPKSDLLIRWNMMFQSPLAHPSVMMRKRVVEEVGGYGSKTIKGKEKFSAEDYDLWDKILKVAKIENILKPLLKLRKHGENLTIVRFDGHINNTGLIGQKYIRDNIGFNLDLGQMDRLRTLKTETLGQYEETKKIINDLYRMFCDELDFSGINEINNDKAYRLLLLIIFSRLNVLQKIIEIVKLYVTNLSFVGETFCRIGRHFS